MAIRLPALTAADPNEVLRPARRWFVAATLMLALTFNLLPLAGTALVLRPDFLALLILYWCIQAPRYVGVGVAWMMGLLMDVGDATLFGQHALAYAFLAYAAEHNLLVSAGSDSHSPNRLPIKYPAANCRALLERLGVTVL